MLQKEEKLKGFIHHLLIQVYTNITISLSVTSHPHLQTLFQTNIYLNLPYQKGLGQIFSLFFASVNILPSKKKKKVRLRSTKLTFITKQYEHSTRTAQRPPAGSCQVLHPRQKNWINNTRDSHLVPHGSTKRASSDLASKFGMGFGAVHSLWSLTILSTSRTYIKSFQ